MNSLRRFLSIAQYRMDEAIPFLELVRRRAEQQSYAPEWLAAIDRAMRVNQENIVHIGNIIAEITRWEKEDAK